MHAKQAPDLSEATGDKSKVLLCFPSDWPWSSCHFGAPAGRPCQWLMLMTFALSPRNGRHMREEGHSKLNLLS